MRHQHWQLKHHEPQAEAFAWGADKTQFGPCHILRLCNQHWPEFRNYSVGENHLLIGSLQNFSLYCEWKVVESQAGRCWGTCPSKVTQFRALDWSKVLRKCYFYCWFWAQFCSGGDLVIVHSEVNQRYIEQRFGWTVGWLFSPFVWKSNPEASRGLLKWGQAVMPNDFWKSSMSTRTQLSATRSHFLDGSVSCAV